MGLFLGHTMRTIFLEAEDQLAFQSINSTKYGVSRLKFIYVGAGGPGSFCCLEGFLGTCCF